MTSGELGISQLHIFPLSRSVEAFELAGDRGVASKVLLDLDSE